LFVVKDLWDRAREVASLNAKVEELEELLEKFTVKEAQSEALAIEAQHLTSVKKKVSGWWRKGGVGGGDGSGD